MSHFLESEDELLVLREGSGPLVAGLQERGIPTPQWQRSPLQALADVLGPHVVAVHMVHADGEDLETLAAAGAALAHCPRSNARLGCGVLDLDTVERAGILVGLGTDSPASAGPIDMFAEMRSALELHRAVGGDATRPDAVRLLELATVDAARALGYDDVGILAPGASADVVACAIEPAADPTRSYVLTGAPAHVRAVLVGGDPIWRHDRNELRIAEQRAFEARQLLALPVPERASR